MRNKTFKIFLFIAFILAIGIVGNKLIFEPKIKILKVGNAVFTVEIADTPYKQFRGLSGRKELSENHGMLFIFADKNYHNFWMKGMMIPLDFLWINGGKVVEITENVKPEDYQPPKSFTSKFPADEVLEINAGTARKLNLKVGDKVGF